MWHDGSTRVSDISVIDFDAGTRPFQPTGDPGPTYLQHYIYDLVLRSKTGTEVRIDTLQIVTDTNVYSSSALASAIRSVLAEDFLFV